MAYKSFSVFLESPTPKVKGRPKSNDYDLDAMAKQVDALKNDKEAMAKLLVDFKKMNKEPIYKLVRAKIKEYDLGRITKLGAKTKAEKEAAGDDDNEPEGTQPVFAFVVLTDSSSNRFFLNKAKTKFGKYDKNDVYAVKIGTSAELEGKSKGQLKPIKNKILNALPQQIGKYDIYEDDITVMDSFELQGAPAAMYGSDGSMDDEF